MRATAGDVETNKAKTGDEKMQVYNTITINRERDATHLENIMRNEVGVELRESYEVNIKGVVMFGGKYKDYKLMNEKGEKFMYSIKVFEKYSREEYQEKRDIYRDFEISQQQENK
ncbi:hypothetical protein Fleli_0350 [Bernardetia litoralis DSM 6794]|uniref:Uncharacterized protein n=1 Tax=Bernardetia litoralis (strain ATCC 23117 / DSM 6794 / NBRC 15988 / NCIMB 1366 / Fx l1 / Sio-4) TaxID=880071 RepID=I4AFU6_BERLS|nr:hypothetical protein [Bernardetia litoralis]AFM02831.1 hypothetical protein Fleli_0350 [Bernardetia litoralis DSM 6794]